MSEHDKIRGLLVVAAAGALTSAEEKQVADHLRSCMACSNELDAWRPIANDLRRLPTPQPSSRLLQATLALAQEKLAEQAEHDWNRRLIAFVVAFAWLLTIASWLLFYFVGRRFVGLLGPQFAGTWIGFAAFTVLGWFAGGVAAGMLAVRQRDERRLV
jgi:anti-sigma factor RsiW